jgi:large subunit ribosomal protein L24
MARILTQRKTAKKRNVVRHKINAERQKLHVTTGDVVRVVRGDDKGKEGKVLRVLPKTGRIVVEGVNIVKKHRKARTQEEQGGIISMEAPLHASNVMLLDPKENKPTRTKRRIDADGTKERLSVKSGEPIPRAR